MIYFNPLHFSPVSPVFRLYRRRLTSQCHWRRQHLKIFQLSKARRFGGTGINGVEKIMVGLWASALSPGLDEVDEVEVSKTISTTPTGWQKTEVGVKETNYTCSTDTPMTTTITVNISAGALNFQPRPGRSLLLFNCQCVLWHGPQCYFSTPSHQVSLAHPTS